MSNENLKLLSVYHTLKEHFNNNKAHPLLKAIDPFLMSSPVNIDKLAEACKPHVAAEVKTDKLTTVLKNLFSDVDRKSKLISGYLGEELTYDQVIEYSTFQDSFAVVFREYISHSELIKRDVLEKVRLGLVDSLIEFNFVGTENSILKKFFANHGKRIPVTIEEKRIPLLIDDMYEIACKYVSPTEVDRILSDCVNVARDEVDYYNARRML